jgi:MFS family permease
MVCYTLSYADRLILTFLVGPMKQDLRISDTQVGLLQGFAFALVYTTVGLPLGALADRFSRRNLIALGVVVWSCATSLASVARSFGSLAVARMGVGIGEAALSPCAFSMIADSFPKERLGSALSVYTMGIQLGSGLALIIGGMVAQAVSHMAPIALPVLGTIAPWRLSFLIVGLPGLLIALLALSIREPARQSLIKDSAGLAAPLSVAEVLGQIRLRWRSTCGLAVVISCQATCNYALLAWGASFFERAHGWPKDRTGLVLGLTTLACGCLGLLAGGTWSDRWHRRGWVDAPLRVGLVSLVGLALTLVPATLVPAAGGTVALLVPAVFCIGLPIGCGYAALQLIFPNQARGLVSALVIFAVALIGYGFGAVLPGLFDDYLFHDESKIGYSISLTVAMACTVGIAGAFATFAPYRADYRAVHSE